MKMTYLKNVASLKIDAGKCIGCDVCMSVCPEWHEVKPFFDSGSGGGFL